jgi:hypothetical protein
VSVDVDRVQWGILGRGELLRLAVNLAAAGEDQPGTVLGGEGGVHNVSRAADVGGSAALRVALAPDDARDRGEVDDAHTADERFLNHLRIPYVGA